MTKGLSKSRYTALCQCPKNLWLKMYKPDEATSSWNQKKPKPVAKPPPLLRTRHLGYGKSLGETERSGRIN